MISGLDLTSVVDYTLKDDKENPTIWKLGVIPAYMFAKLSGETTDKIDITYKVIQLSLKGWENFNVPFQTVKENFFGREYDVVPLSVLEKIPLNVISELSLKIVEINQISAGERKN